MREFFSAEEQSVVKRSMAKIQQLQTEIASAQGKLSAVAEIAAARRGWLGKKVLVNWEHGWLELEIEETPEPTVKAPWHEQESTPASE